MNKANRPSISAAVLTLLWLCLGVSLAAQESGAALADTTVDTSASTAHTPSPTVSMLLDSLLGDPEGRTATIKALVDSADESLLGLFQNLFKGNVYEYTPPGDTAKRLIIAGAEEDREGETWVPLLNMVPMEPLKDAEGKALYARLEDLTEYETDREVRQLLQPVLTSLELKSRDPRKRRAAALSMGESGDTLMAAPLQAALNTEPEEGTRHIIREALGRLGLRSPDPIRRKAAAAELGEIRATNVLPELKALIEPKEGVFPEPDEDVRAVIMTAVGRIEAWNSFTGAVQNLFSGLSLGSILILMALGLAIIFGLMGVINMAHGEFMMIGAYATFLIQHAFLKYAPEAYFGWFLAASMPLSFLTAGLIGMAVEYLVIKRLYGRPLETLLATWGISLLFIQTARNIFGDLTAVSSPKLLTQGWEIFPQVVLPYNRIFIILLTAAVVAAMAFVFFRTRLGTKVRAVTQNRGMSACLGIATRRVDAFTFGLGTGIAGLAGCALTQIGNVDPGMGQNYIVDSFLVVVTGGVGKLAGTVVSGLCIGSLNKFLEPFLQSVYAKVTLLALVILFLQRRPSGLFPAKGRHEDT